MSLLFGQACRHAGIARSMGSRGDAFDNAVAESFFATLKKELVHRRSWPTRHELSTAVFDYIEIFYNSTRRHSTLGMRSPAEHEQIHSIKINNETKTPLHPTAKPSRSERRARARAAGAAGSE